MRAGGAHACAHPLRYSARASSADSIQQEGIVNHVSNEPAQAREIRLAELEGRRYQKTRLQSALDHCIQTHQDATPLAEQLATVDAEIARLEEALRC